MVDAEAEKAGMTGAEKYFAQLKESPAYRAAHDEARAEIVGENGVWLSWRPGGAQVSPHLCELDALRNAVAIGGQATFLVWGGILWTEPDGS